MVFLTASTDCLFNCFKNLCLVISGVKGKISLFVLLFSLCFRTLLWPILSKVLTESVYSSNFLVFLALLDTGKSFNNTRMDIMRNIERIKVGSVPRKQKICFSTVYCHQKRRVPSIDGLQSNGTHKKTLVPFKQNRNVCSHVK